MRQAPIRAQHAQRTSLLTTILVAALSAITSLTVAYSSYHLNSVTQKAADESHRQDTYAKLIADLGSENAEARVGAAVGLGPYARDDAERRDQTVAILTTLLTTEKNSQVLQALISSLVEAGAPAIDRVAEANRYARQQYVSDTSAIVFSHMDKFYSYVQTALKTKPDGSPAVSGDDIGTRFTGDARDRFNRFVYPQIEEQIDFSLLTERERQALTATRNRGGEADNSPAAVLHDSLFSLASGLLGDFDQVEAGFDELNSISVVTQATELARDAKRLPDEARAVYLTGIVLARLMAANPAAMEKKNLRGIVLIGANLRLVHAKGLNLERAFIVGDADSADLSEEDLMAANLAYLDLFNADFTQSLLTAAILPNGPSIANANFTDANWEDSLNAGGDPEKTVWVGVIPSRAHPGVTGSPTRNCVNKDDPAITF
ncbi:MAG TPA: hypothetical protein VFV07_12770, partial [Rhizomicrobium sp.]|nr:hypothetical protein [Rhizomicrobium sp.]